MFGDVILTILLSVLNLYALWSIINQKKKGKGCFGCADSSNCCGCRKKNSEEKMRRYDDVWDENSND